MDFYLICSISVGNFAFRGCASLTNITIPDNVTSIGYYAFKCDSLVSVTFEGVIAKTGFGDAFIGDLQFKYFATNGGPGTYTQKSRNKWSKEKNTFGDYCCFNDHLSNVGKLFCI